MTLTNPSASAYPYAFNPSVDFSLEPGLSKREYFAGLAMHALILGYALADLEVSQPAHHIAALAVDQADALIGELNEELEGPNRSQGHPEQG